MTTLPVNTKNLLKDTPENLKKIVNEITRELDEKNRELSDLSTIGVALSAEQDYEKLLTLILTKCRDITNCDAGSLYLIKESNKSGKKLIFKSVQNDSLSNLSFQEYSLPVTKTSIAGYVALTGEVLNMEDAYNLPEGAEYTFCEIFDKKFKYRTKSMLSIPMKDHKNKIIGVVQLINRKKSRNIKLTSDGAIDAEVIPFDGISIEILNSLASQAAVSIENNILYQNIQNLFDGFVKASIHAIEQRDPTTFGHSERVAAMTVGLAELVNKAEEGKYKDMHFTDDQMKELRYAGLLHDFGKVGVREDVLVKEKKLYPLDLELIKSRFDFIKKSMECIYLKKKIDMTLKNDKEDLKIAFDEIDETLKDEIKKLDNYLSVIVNANEPAELEDKMFIEIKKIAGSIYQDYDNKDKHYLTQQELDYLCIRKGTLSENERIEIESHAKHSYEFLKKIPWTKELENIPSIAHAHHEKLDGTGYNLNLSKEQIPLQSKIIAIVDIYDALTASDRPYKKAIPHEKALQIIGFEVKDDHVDAELFDMFLKGKIYELANTTS